jgi:hypothetical protein
VSNLRSCSIDERNFLDSHPQTRSLIYSIPFLVQFQLLGREGWAGQISSLVKRSDFKPPIRRNEPLTSLFLSFLKIKFWVRGERAVYSKAVILTLTSIILRDGTFALGHMPWMQVQKYWLLLSIVYIPLKD